MAEVGSAHIDLAMKNAKMIKALKSNVKELKRMEKELRRNQKQMRYNQVEAAKFRNTLKSIAGWFTTGLSIGVTIQKLKEFNKIGLEARKRSDILARSIENAGVSIGVTAPQMERLVESVSAMAGLSLNESREAAAQLISIAENSKLAGDNIERTFRLAQDMASAGFGDLKGNIEEIAEVLALPKEAVTTLEKYNVFFDDAAKKHLDLLVDSGKELEAMELIYDRMEAKFKGTTAAGAEGVRGEIAAADVAYQKMTESLGQAITESDSFRSATRDMTKIMEWATKFIRGFITDDSTQGQHAQAVDAVQAAQDRLEAARSWTSRPLRKVFNEKLFGAEYEPTPDEKIARKELNAAIEKERFLRKKLTDQVHREISGIDPLKKQIEKAEEINRNLARQHQLYADTVTQSDELLRTQRRGVYEEYAQTRTESDDKAWEENKKAVEENTKALEKAADQAKEDEKRRRQTIEDAIQSAKDQTDLLKIISPENPTGGLPRAKRDFIASGLFDLGLSVDKKISDKDLGRYSDALSELYDQQEANRQAEKTMQNIKDVTSDVVGGIRDMSLAMTDFWEDGEFQMEKFRKKFLDVVQNIVNKLSDKLLWEPLAENLGNILSQSFTGTSASSGAHVQRGQPKIVGETGTEIFVPAQNGTIVSNRDMMKMFGGGGPTVNLGGISIVSNDADGVRRIVFGELLPTIEGVVANAAVSRTRQPGRYRTALKRV